MGKQTVEPEPMIFSNSSELAGRLKGWFADQFQGKKFCLIFVCENEPDVKKGFEMPAIAKGSINRVLVVFKGRPIDLEAMGTWREWAIETVKAWDLRMDFVSKDATEDELRQVVERNCAPWFADPPPPEKIGIAIKKWVKMPIAKTAKDDSSLLTMMFGSMGELLTEVEVVARRFSEAVERLDMGAKAEYRDKIDSLLKQPGKEDTKRGSLSRTENEKDLLGIGNVTDQLPKLLLLGETGVGKTLIAEYLHKRCGLEGRPLHVSIPEYLGKEDMFEYTLFGYAAGNYTGGREDGDHGLLIENVGRVVFLDEIGEANAAIQAKLLTFLDHYRVRPRGWLGDPFYCPVLIVAATNRDLDEAVEGKPRFRRDLLARFTDRHRIPALRDRKQDFEFILDCLLQRQSMNPAGFVENIGKDALTFLKAADFKDGNFRELEDLFRGACRKAQREDRRHLVKSDFERPTSELQS